MDLILTNKSRSFQSTYVMETGLFDFNRMTVSVLKTHFRKLPAKVVTYRNFKKFENEKLMDSLKLTINSQDVDYTENYARMNLSIMLQEKKEPLWEQ